MKEKRIGGTEIPRAKVIGKKVLARGKKITKKISRKLPETSERTDKK